MARKGWENLSADRRRRLERQGITRQSYASGARIRETRTYGQRKERTFRRYGITPNQLTRLRRDNPEAARQADHISNLRRTNPAEAKRIGRDRFYSASEDERTITVSGEQVINPLYFYH